MQIQPAGISPGPQALGARPSSGHEAEAIQDLWVPEAPGPVAPVPQRRADSVPAVAPASAAPSTASAAGASTASVVSSGAGATPPAGVGAVEGLQVLRDLERIPKGEHRYEVLGHASASDGCLYLLYGEKGTDAGYVARQLADGRVDWEAAVDAPRCLAPDNQGGVCVAGKASRVRFTSGGRESEKTPVPSGAEPAWVDPSNGATVGVGRLGDVVASPGLSLPRALRGQAVETSVFSRRGDSIHLETRLGWAVLEAGGSSRFVPSPTDAPAKGVWVFTDDVHPLADGTAIFEMHRTVEIPMRPFVGGMLMPNHRGPREPGHDYDTRMCLRRCAPDGSTLWETPTLGRMLQVVVEADGSAWTINESHGERGENTVSHILPDGTVDRQDEVPGPPYSLVAAGQDAFVSNSRGISWCQAGGRVSLIPGSRDWRARDVQPDGRLLVVDEAGTRAALLDPSSGTVVPLTDLEHDHVLSRRDEIEKAVQDLSPQPGGSVPDAPQVVVQDDWIVVGGVRVPRHKTTDRG